MKLRTFLAATATGALAAGTPVAHAQPPDPTGDGTIGAPVPSMLELTITRPKPGLTTFPKAKTYSTSFAVAVTTTDAAAQLSLADGDVATGSKRGRFASGSKLLPLPVEARVGTAAFAPLNLPVDAPLAKLTGPTTAKSTTINVRQQVRAKATGSYRKLLLVTLSTGTP